MAPIDERRLALALLRGTADAIVYADREGAIRYWNAGAERLFGYRAGEVLGRSLDVLVPERQRARHWEGYRRVMETGVSRYAAGNTLSVPSARKDGSRLSIEFTILPLHDEDGRMEGMAAVMRDVTPRFQEVRDLRKRLAALEGPGSPERP